MKILVVGISVRAMAESAVHNNYPVIALDAFGDQDLRALTECYSLRHEFGVEYNPQTLYHVGRKLAFDAVAYTSNLENHPDVLRRFAASNRIIGNSPQVVGSVRNWESLFAGLRQSGFSAPQTILHGENPKVNRDRRWLLKPILSGGGHGIRFLRKERSAGDRAMLQEYIPGKPCSASFLANGHECVLIGITEQFIGLRQFGSYGFRYCGNLLPVQEVLDPDSRGVILDQVRRLAAYLTREYGLTGVNGIDFVLNRNHQVWLTEVNPRYSASMEIIERAYRLPVFHLHAQAVLDGRLPEFELETMLNGRFFGKAILFAERDAVASDTQTWHARGIRDIPASGEKLRRGSPVCTILTSGPTYNETMAELIRLAAALKKEIYG